MKMTNQTAIKDTSFYADFCDYSKMWCVFGDNSGKAYSTHMDRRGPGGAEEAAEARNASLVQPTKDC